jgi:hypothetical protein
VTSPLRPDPLLKIARDELANTRQAIERHLASCQAPRDEPGSSLTGACWECRSLSRHLMRTEEQVRLLGGEETAQTGELF